MGGSSVFKAPIKIAQKAGIIKKATPPPAPKPVAPPVVTPVVAPTVAEVSQSEAANAVAYGLKKRKGRSATIMTGPTGVENEDLVLGTPTLLGS
tara:strand:- start:330 stop:611 length:282 start_codon:yes stop_codon:yes gene_type:complete